MITLSGLLSVIHSEKIIKVNLYDSEDLLKISFDLPGYAALENQLEECEVTKIEIVNLFNINVTIDTEPDGNMGGNTDPDPSDPVTDPADPVNP
jgi:hypothetical protein